MSRSKQRSGPSEEELRETRADELINRLDEESSERGETLREYALFLRCLAARVRNRCESAQEEAKGYDD